jgi:hypothetical protein
MPFNEIVVMTENERFITLVHSKPKGSGQVFMIFIYNQPTAPTGRTEGVRPSFHDF